MKASIVILTKNAGSRFRLLLDKMNSQSYNDFEILVIDSGSTDSTLKIAREFGAKIYNIKPKEFHHSITRNLGAELAKGDVLVYITQDALPINNNWLANLLSPLEDNGVAGVYGRQIAYEDANPMEKFFYSYFYPKTRRVVSCTDLNRGLQEFYINYVFLSNVNSALKKEVWRRYKFDKNIIMAEDKKWAIDVLKDGHNVVYEPKAAVYHSHNYSLISIFKRRFDDGVAMKQICDSGGVALEGLLYLFGEMKYLLRNHKIWIPYALVYNFVRLAGVALGKHYEYIPNVLRKRMSKHKGWWIRDE
jgi:rhamnosyltransferase